MNPWCVGTWYGDLISTLFTILFSIVLGIGIGYMIWGKKCRKDENQKVREGVK